MNKTETDSPPVTTMVAPASREQRFGRRSSRDVLGLAWLNGAFHATVFRRQQVVQSWECKTSVATFEEFAVALDGAIAATKFNGTEVFVILAHDKFVHQVEVTPSFSKSAVRTYLRNWIERYEKTHDPVLWVSQPAMGGRDQNAHIIHILPAAMYRDLNQILLARRLDLSRVLPVFVPLQLSLSSLTETKDLPVLVAAEVGETTAVIVGKTGGQIYFGRTILASWKTDPARVAVETNRSLLYAKQQYGENVDFVWLLGPNADVAAPEVSTKCGASTEVLTEPHTPVDWLKAVARLSPRHPVNLVAGYLRRKRQVAFLRRLALAACWLTAGFVGFGIWENEQAWRREKQDLEKLRNREPMLVQEHDRLTRRNDRAEQNREFIAQIETGRLPPVPSKFLAYFASVLPREGRLTSFVVKWDDQLDEWTFSIEGFLEADRETARSMVTVMRRQLAESPLRIRFLDSSRQATSTTFDNEGGSFQQNFKLEGGLFAN